MRDVILLFIMLLSAEHLYSQNIYFQNRKILEDALIDRHDYDSIYPMLHSRIYAPKKIKADQELMRFIDSAFRSGEKVLRKKEVRRVLGRRYEIRENIRSYYYSISIAGPGYIVALLYYDSSGNFEIQICNKLDPSKNYHLMYYDHGDGLNVVYPINYLLPFVTSEIKFGGFSSDAFFTLSKKYTYIPITLFKKHKSEYFGK